MKSDNKWRIYSNWPERKLKICQNILQSKPTYVCLQEISEETLQDIISELFDDNYQLAHVAFHSSLETIQKHGVAIFYNKRDVELIDKGTIQHFQNGNKYRSSVWATFKDLKNHKIVKVSSVHLKGYDPFEENDVKESQKKIGFEELKSYTEQLLDQDIENVDGLIIAGDFNEDLSEENSPLFRMKYLEKQGFTCDSNDNFTEPSTKRRIDWIFYKPMSKSGKTTLALLDIENTQLEVSDHLMTGTKLVWDV